MVRSDCFGQADLRDSIKMDNNYEILMMKYQDNPRMIGSPSISSGGRGFRLGQQNILDLNSTSVIERVSQKFDKSSICSGSIASCKQKIDAMFETQSVQSHPIGLKTSLIRTNDGEDSDESINQNNIQMKIDKMFSEIHDDFDKKDEDNTTDSDSRTSHCYHVDYLGSVSLNNKKINSLESLQEPLKNLYFNYMKSLESNNRACSLMSSLEITATGLRINCNVNGREKEQTNPFATIAVWAAVKFICRPRSLNHGKEFGMEYSFMPLISNSDANDKAALFQRLTSNETLVFENKNIDNLPIFVVVMKKLASKQLECHGFVCESNDLAVTIAAKLYKALVRAMSEPNAKHKLKHFNGISSMSVSSSSDFNNKNRLNGKPRLRRTDGSGRESSQVSNNQFQRNQNRKSFRSSSSVSDLGNEARFQEVTVVIENDRTPNMPRSSHAFKAKEDFSKPPKRPPKSNTVRSLSGSISSATKVTQTDFDDIRPRHSKAPNHASPMKSFRSPVNEVLNQNLRRSASERCHSGVQSMMDTQSGDIFTKVAIPRSRSFLNANGPLVTNYNRSSRNHPTSDLSKRVLKESSPLGFNEIFTELQLQEGLNSMDDILNAIINREGMSFNDLKPIYKEFLLKLALTLTKDELYERSKLIMQRQQKVSKKQKRKRSKSSSIASNLSLKNAFRKSVSKLNQRKKKCKKRGGTLEFTSGVFPADKHKKSKSDYTDTSVTTWSSYFSRSKRTSARASRRPSFKVSHRKARSSRRPSQRRPHQSKASTSEDSDFFSLIRCDKSSKSHRNGDCFHQSSSGYFSYSECSCNTESCSCSSATKCYCSLAPRPRPRSHPGPRSRTRSQPLIDSGALSMSSCDCDTDSCVESEKCYCNNLRNLSAFEQLKQQGFAASDSSLSRAASPTTAWQKNESLLQETTRSKPGHLGAQSSKSLEFVQFNRAQSQKGDKKGSYFNRMDVYDSLNYKNHPSSSSFSYHNASSQASTINSRRKSLSSDNLALDYDMFSSSKAGKQPRDHRKEKKVLVVSARDSKGRIIYLDSGRPENGRQRSLTRSNSHMTATEALSVKKSAEIAALFSNSTSMQKCISQPYKVTRDAVIYNAIQSPDSCIVQGNEPHYLKHSNLENSLGYYP